MAMEGGIDGGMDPGGGTGGKPGGGMPEHRNIALFSEVTFCCIIMPNKLNYAHFRGRLKGLHIITISALPGMGIAVPIAVRTGVGALGGGGASANSW